VYSVCCSLRIFSTLLGRPLHAGDSSAGRLSIHSAYCDLIIIKERIRGVLLRFEGFGDSESDFIGGSWSEELEPAFEDSRGEELFNKGDKDLVIIFIIDLIRG